MSTSRGFTLIELLIVIVIIGITVGFALIAFGDFGAGRRIIFSAEQLANTLRVAQQQAILETTTLGLQVDSTGYQILKFQNTANWQPISNKGIFKASYFPKDTIVILQTSNKPLQGNPAIIISPSGDTTPFTLSFATSKDKPLITLQGNHNGTIKSILGETK